MRDIDKSNPTRNRMGSAGQEIHQQH